MTSLETVQASDIHLENRVGVFASNLTLVLTLLTFAIAIFTPPLSGPFCQAGCYQYPFTDVVSRFPRDYWWMYPAIALSVAYLLLIASVHSIATPGGRVFSRVSMSFATISTGALVIDYFIQLSVVQASLLKGETDGISLLTQFNPHGVFIALEEAGFLMMTLSFAFLVPVFPSVGRLYIALRRIFCTNLFLTGAAFAFIGTKYGIAREYRFEVAVITINWMTLIVASLILRKLFKVRGS